MLFVLPPGADFLSAFFGALVAGRIPVPTYPPDPARIEHSTTLLEGIAASCEPALCLTTAELASLAEFGFAGRPTLQALPLLAVDALGAQPPLTNLPRLELGEPAFLQYTSGSTGSPKGVVVTHGNLVANSLAMRDNWGITSETVAVSWLPLYHDMGLIGNAMQVPFWNIKLHLLSPVDFLRDPVCWLNAVSRYRATASGAPNFAYDLCVRRASDADISRLDLSSWVSAFNAAEPIRPETISRFADRFAPSGFRKSAFHTCYGLAESTMLVTGLPGCKTLVVDEDALAAGRVQAITENSPRTGKVKTLVSSGQSTDCTIRIVSPESRRCVPPSEIGEVWLRGPSVCAGYWNDPNETARVFAAQLDSDDGVPYLRTGDLGFLHDGELFITGRQRDLIIIRGRNHFPQDLEATAERSHPAIRPGATIACSVATDAGEVIVILAEVREPAGDDLESIARAIASSVLRDHQVPCDTVVLLKPRSIAKTSSGKIRRRPAAQAFLSGSLGGELFRHVVRGTSPIAESRAAPTGSTAAVAHRQAMRAIPVEGRAPSPPGNSGPDGAGPSSRSFQAVAGDLERIASLVEQAVRDSFTEDPAQPALNFSWDTAFEELGLDSLAAAEVATRVERATGLAIEGPDLYRLRTIRHVARFLASSATPPVAVDAVREAAVSAPQVAASTSPSGPYRGLLERYRQMNQRIEDWKARGEYYFHTEIQAQDGPWVTVDGKRMLMLASYSYLGLIHHPTIREQARTYAAELGGGVHGVRALAGTLAAHKDLERRISAVTGCEDAVLFSSGYVANVAAISTLVRPGDAIIGDEWNHASIVDGCGLSGATLYTYRHNDMAHLEARLVETHGRPTLVVVDSVFSMEGDVVDLPAVVDLCRRHEALLMVDDAHGFGVLGKRGRGVCEHFDLPDDAVDVKMATLAKALGASGGFVASSQAITDLLRHNARGYVFSGAMAPGDVAAGLAALDVLVNEPERVEHLRQIVGRYRAGLHRVGFDVLGSTTHVVPIACRSEDRTLAMTRLCREEALFVVPVFYPAVPMNAPRLRTCLTAAHTDEHVDFALDVLTRAGREVGLI